MPDTSDVGTSLEDLAVESPFPELVHQIDTAESGANDKNLSVEVLRVVLIIGVCCLIGSTNVSSEMHHSVVVTLLRVEWILFVILRVLIDSRFTWHQGTRSFLYTRQWLLAPSVMISGTISKLHATNATMSCLNPSASHPSTSSDGPGALLTILDSGDLSWEPFWPGIRHIPKGTS